MSHQDEFCCSKRLLDKTTARRPPLVNSMKYYQHLINNMTRRICNSAAHHNNSSRETTKTMLIVIVALLSLAQFATIRETHASPQHATSSGGAQQNHHHAHLMARHKGAAAVAAIAEQLPAQARVGGLDASDYIDEAGELDVLINQQQIPTAQLMAAAGHIVPDNFFLPGGSIPAGLYAQQQRYLQAAQQQQQHHQQQQQQLQHQQQLQQQERQQSQQLQQQQQQDVMQQVASQVQARVVPAPARYADQQRARAIELMMAAAAEQQQQQHQGQDSAASLIDFNGYSLTSQPDPRDAAASMDLVEFLGGPQAVANNPQAASMVTLYEQQLLAAQQQLQQQQQQQHQHQHGVDPAANLIDQMAAMASNQQQEHVAASDGEHYLAPGGGSSIGPDYQLIGNQEYPSNNYEAGKSSPTGGADPHQTASSSHSHQQQQQSSNHHHHQQQQQQRGQRPFGLPTKSSDKEPPGMLKPLDNPKTISSPLIDFAANNLPKNTGLEKLAEKLPQHQTPTVFSFSSSKDPSEKVKSVNQKKRNVMRQAEQIARLMIKSFNDKFGTNLGDQTDIPFLLSSLGPLGFAQNVLFDPTLLVSLLNTAEKTYFSDVLPAPAKQVIKPVLNIFRVPNKKRDKANLLNIISYLTSGGQTSSSVPSKHRQSFGIEKSSSSSSSFKKDNKQNR